MVIELPLAFAVRSAYYFARGGIQLLDACGITDYLAFGSECGSLDALQNIAGFLADESPQYKKNLQNALSEGISFPLARSLALQQIPGQQETDMSYIVSEPNNILGIEYLINLQRLGSSIRPYTFQRAGRGYSDEQLAGMASATAIRQALFRGCESTELADFMPAGALYTLHKEIQAGRAPVFIKSLEAPLLSKLRNSSREQLASLLDINEGLHNRIYDAAFNTGTYEDLRQAIKSKRYNMTRVNRVLLYALLEYDSKTARQFDESGPLYAHVLAFSRTGQRLIKKIKASGSLPVLGRGHDTKRFCMEHAGDLSAAMLELDIRAGNLYTLAYPGHDQRLGHPDYRQSSALFSQDD